MKQLLLALSLIASSLCFSGNDEQLQLAALAPLYQSKWHFLEDLVITKPQATTMELFGNGGKIGLQSLIASAGVFYLTKKGFEHVLDTRQRANQQSFFSEKVRRIISFGAAGLTGYASYAYLQSSYQTEEAAKQLNRIFEEWTMASKFLPTEVQDGLEHFYMLRKKDMPLYKKHEAEIVRLLTAAICEHFSGKYYHEAYFSAQNFRVHNLIRLARFAKEIMQ